MDSEFAQFIKTLRRLGIAFEINHHADPKKWQRVILDAGYNVTTAACWIITVGDTEHLFCTGAVGTTSDDQPVGPGGVFMLGRKKDGEIVPRCIYATNGRPIPNVHNLDALKLQYPTHDWHLCVPVAKAA